MTDRTGFTVYFIDGGYVNFPNAPKEQSDTVVEWYKTSPADYFITLNTETGKSIIAQHQSITRIVIE